MNNQFTSTYFTRIYVNKIFSFLFFLNEGPEIKKNCISFFIPPVAKTQYTWFIPVGGAAPVQNLGVKHTHMQHAHTVPPTGLLLGWWWAGFSSFCFVLFVKEHAKRNLWFSISCLSPPPFSCETMEGLTVFPASLPFPPFSPRPMERRTVDSREVVPFCLLVPNQPLRPPLYPHPTDPSTLAPVVRSLISKSANMFSVLNDSMTSRVSALSGPCS